MSKMTEQERLEKKRAYGREYYRRHKDEDGFKQRMEESRRAFMMREPDKAGLYRKSYRKRNPERVSEYSRRYYQTHRESSIERSKKWRREHPEKVSEYNRRYHLKSSAELKTDKPRARKKPSFDKIKSLFKNPEDAEKHFKWLSAASEDKKESEVKMK